MTFYLLGACVAFAAFGAVNLLVSGALWIAWPLAKKRLEALPARPRARWLLALRLSPVALGALASASVALPSFLEFEPRDTTEEPGRALLALSVAGLALTLLAAARMVRAHAKTRRVVEAWTRGSRADPPRGGRAAGRSRRGRSADRGPLRLAPTRPLRVGSRARRIREAADPRHRGPRGRPPPRVGQPRASPAGGLRRSARGLPRRARDGHCLGSRGRGSRRRRRRRLGHGPVGLGRCTGVRRPPGVHRRPGRPFPRRPSTAETASTAGCGGFSRCRRGAAAPAPPRRLRRALAALLIAAASVLTAESLHRPLHRLLERAVTTPHAHLRALVVDHPHA